MHLSTPVQHTWVVSLYISIVHVCHFERYICFFSLVLSQGLLSTSDNIFALCSYKSLRCNKMRSVEKCSPFVHCMIFSESCLEDKSSGNI